MSRELRPGDRVTATGTVRHVGRYALDNSPAVTVSIDGDVKGSFVFDGSALTLIEPAEPPVGSVVVKDGVAWTRTLRDWHAHIRGYEYATWTDLSDGDVIFVPGDSK